MHKYPTHFNATAVEEWQPHAAQTNITQEWWYNTAFFHDTKGNLYSLMWTDMKFDGKEVPVAKTNPELAAQLGPDTTLTQCMLAFSSYDLGYRSYHAGLTLNNVSQLWDPETHAKKFDCKGITGSWSFDKGGDKMKLVLNYHNNTQPTKNMSFDLNMTGAKQVMWSKDSAYNTEGFIQEGGRGNVSFYYSLPRQDLSGKVSYIDQLGRNQTLDVTGQAWTDRQWGDWTTRVWEWSSLRFDNGARVNLYSFGNALEGGKAYVIGTYQKSDGSVEWFGNFTTKQNGYTKLSDGNWVSFGWSYDFPIDIEGSKHYTVVPLSNPLSKKIPVDEVYALSNPRMHFVEQGGNLINDTTGETVGKTFTESMPIKRLLNGPYDVNQH